MCLITDDKTLYIAREDIVVYKYLSEIYTLDSGEKAACSLTGKFWYTPGIKYSTQIEESNSWKCADDTAYSWEKKSFEGNSIKKKLLCIGQGFHSYKTKKRAVEGYEEMEMSQRLFKCIIPKWASYYQDNTGLIVSNTLIVVEDIFTEEDINLIIHSRILLEE